MLRGKNVTPKTHTEAKKLIGTKVEYLRNEDIDRSGRGYFFPRWGIVEDVIKRNIVMSNGTIIYLSDLVEMVIPEEDEKTSKPKE